MQATNWQPVFDYLKHEAGFQAAAATATGAASAWLLKLILAPPKDSSPLARPLAARWAAGLLACASFLFLVEQGRLSKVYGVLARHAVAGTNPAPEFHEHLVRNFWDWSTLFAWSPYYAARAILILVIVFVLRMLWKED